jgi:hypothetical protein
MSVRCAALLLLLSAPLPAQDKKPPAKPIDFETAHWAVSSPLPVLPAKDFEPMIEAYFKLWQRKLGDGAAGKLRLKLYFNRDEFNALPGRTGGWLVRSDTLHLLADGAVAQSVAAGGARVYVTAAYPGLEKRTDLPPWLLAGLAAYLGCGQWRDGQVEIDSLKHPQANQFLISLQNLMKSNDWGTLEKGFKSEGRDYETRRRVIDLQAWAVFYYLFNAPAEDGGKSPNGAAVAAMLAALQEGRKLDEAILHLAKPVPGATLAALEKAVKEYFGKIKIEVKDREEGDWHVGETAHYTIYVQKGATNQKTKQTDKQILDELQWKMELLFEKYSLAFKFQGMLPRKAVLKLHRSRNAYFGAGGPPGSAAYYSPSTKELVGYEDSEETGMYWNTLCHEGCHQFFDLAFPGFYESKEIPMWFSEGLADCFGASEIRGREMHIFTLGGTATWRVEAVKQFTQAGQVSSIKDLLEMNQMPFMQRAPVHYPQSWSFVHFLWNYPTLDAGKGQYHEVVIRLIDGFKVGKPRAEVYKEAFQVKGKPLDLDQLEREWKAYVKTLKVRK